MTAPVALVVLGVIETGCIILVVIAILVEVVIFIVVFVDFVVVVDPLFVLGVVVVVFDVIVDCLEIVCLGVVFVLFGVVEAVVLKNFVNSLKTQSLIDFVKKYFIVVGKHCFYAQINFFTFHISETYTITVYLQCISGPGSSFCGCSGGLS